MSTLSPSPDGILTTASKGTYVRYMELHAIDQWRSTAALAPLSQGQTMELLEQVAAVVRERNELRRTVANTRELLDQTRTPWVSMRALLNELQRVVE